ncbi:MAG: hypothetical protein Q7S70_02185, partial [bacterium]|nr:hypothetical protein [bacterium]
MTPTIRKIVVKLQAQLQKYRLRNLKDEVLQGSPPSGMAKEAVLEKVKKIPFWWHGVELGYGIVSPGHHGGISHPSGDKAILRHMNLPENLTGKSVLDIGAWDGFYSFAAEKRGASKVLA